MSIHMTVVGVGVEADIDHAMILKYLGFIPETAGKHMSCDIKEYTVRTEVERYDVKHVNVLNDAVDIEALYVVLCDPTGVDKYSDSTFTDVTRVEFSQFVTELWRRLLCDFPPAEIPEAPKLYTYHAPYISPDVPNVLCFKIEGPMRSIIADTAKSERGAFRLLRGGL